MENNKLNGSSFDIVADNIQKLKELFPEVVTGDNEIDFDNLRDIFEEYDETVVTNDEEFYKFTWWGKKEAKNIAKTSTTKTLRPVKKDSKNWDTTENIYIEGDNLDALKILLGSYRNKIKMIYIDPPYNTGKDFIYKDNHAQTKKENFRKTGQLNEDGFLEQNPKTDDRFHANWLNMIYPRLILTKQLLTEDGVIYISINDEEESSLTKVCDDVFGRNNFVAKLIWTNKEGGGSSDSKLFKIKHEYILVYSKNIDLLNIKGIPVEDIDRYREKDDYFSTRGPYQLIKLDSASLTYSDSLNYPLECPDGTFVYPSNSKEVRSIWRWSPDKVAWGLENDYIVFKKKDGVWNVYTKQYLNADNEGNIIERTNPPVGVIDKYSSTQSSKYLQKLFGTKVFDYSKPYELIKFLIELSVEDGDIILDFFSGSATTAESVLRFNAEKSFSNPYIMVQVEDKTFEFKKDKKVPKKGSENAFKAEYDTISEVGKDRIRLAGEQIKKEYDVDIDIGFKVFKIDESNFIPWNSEVKTKEDVKQAILATGNQLVKGRSELDFVYELMLKLNLQLNDHIDEVILDNEFNNKIYVIKNGFMMICLDENISNSIVDDLLNLKKKLKSTVNQVVLKDSALNDTQSINISETLNINNVKFYTI